MKLGDFLDTIYTPAGKLLVLLCLLVWFVMIALVMHLSGHDPATVGLTLLENAFTSIFTAIMLHLSPSRPPDNPEKAKESKTDNKELKA